MKNRKHQIRLVLIICALNIGLDQWTKYLAQMHLKGKYTHSYFYDTFKWIYAENEGAFLSWGTGFPDWLHFLLLKVIPIIMLVGMFIYLLISDELTKFQVIGLSFIVGGGIGNLYDRIMYGKVVDFMNVGIGSLRTGIFNYADMAILIGIGFLLFSKKKKLLPNT